MSERSRQEPALPQGVLLSQEGSGTLSRNKGSGREAAESETYKTGSEGIPEGPSASAGMGSSLPTRELMLMRARRIAWYGGATVGSWGRENWV